MLSAQTIEIVKATAPRIAENAEAITRRFYILMFAKNPEVQSYFNQAHQHSGGQQRALAGAICAYAANIENLGSLSGAVEVIAQKHCSLGIQPGQYPIVGQHLLTAIQEVLGDDTTAEVMAAWSEAYGLLAKIFIDREAEIYTAQRVVPGGWNGYRRFLVHRKVVENPIITSFYLTPEDNCALATYRPGQYITVRIDHPTTPTSPRNYSLSDRPETGYYRISVKREVGTQADTPAGLISNYLHDYVTEGSVLDIGPPCGEFCLDPAEPGDRPFVLLSGGIGITPVIAMLKSLAHCHVANPVHFIHGTRNSRSHALAEEVRSIAAKCPNVQSHVRYGAPLPTDWDQQRCDSVGIVDVNFLKQLLPSNDAEYYICGPKPFMANLYRGLLDWGVSDRQIYFEFFGPKQDISAGATTLCVGGPRT